MSLKDISTNLDKLLSCVELARTECAAMRQALQTQNVITESPTILPETESVIDARALFTRQ
jgi:hypothetical protein